MMPERNIQTWETLYSGFEEATPLAFGYDDHGNNGDGAWCLEIREHVELERLVAAWALLISRYSGERRISLGIQPAGQPECRPLRLDVNEELTGTAYQHSVQQQLALFLEDTSLSATGLRERLELASDQPLFNSWIVAPSDSDRAIHGLGNYEAGTLDQVRTHLEHLLEGLAQDYPIYEIQHMGIREREQLVHEWNPDPTAYPESTVHALVEKRASERPEAIALVSENQRLTYHALNARANRLAHHLVQCGVKPEQGVAICLERGVQQLVATLAILKAGAAYIPMDPALPVERLTQMLEDARPELIVSRKGIADRMDGFPGISIIAMDTIPDVLEQCPDTNPAVDISPDALAYIMFTSGSTGRPKGVEIRHRGIVRLLFGVDYVPLGEDTVMLHMATPVFDAATFEIWGALLHGGTCVLAVQPVPMLDTVRELIERNGVNTALMTTSYFHMAVSDAPQILAPLRYLLAGGEALSAWHARKAMRELPGLKLVNAYGPTENTVITTTHALDPENLGDDDTIPIGRPIGNTRCYVLDRFLRPVPIGVPGELYVGGDGVARGYVNRPELSKRRFVPDPFSDAAGATLYKTGDQVYWNHAGAIEYIGRTDHQIKLRGFRIELQEVEGVLGAFDGVEQAVAIIVEDEARGKSLVGYVKVPDPSACPIHELAGFVRERLPGYMVPSSLIPVAEWNYTPSGKLDRKALPKPEPCSLRTTVVEPVTDSEILLADLWTKLLSRECIGVDDNFFELGGDSLLAVRLFHEVARRTGCELDLAILNRAPTVRELASALDRVATAGSPKGDFRSLQIVQQGDASVAPLFLIHGGMGNVLVFHAFAGRLNSRQPVIAFQWSGWDGMPGDRSIRNMAKRYVDELMHFYPEGPMRIGGYCVGGLIAIEMIRLLEKAGRSIEGPLLVWDLPNIRSKHYHPGEPWDSEDSLRRFTKMSEALRDLREPSEGSESRAKEHFAAPTGLRARIGAVPGVLPLLRRARALETTLKRLPEQLRITRARIMRRPVPIPLRATLCARKLIRAAKHHNPSMIDRDVLYFRSEYLLGREFGLCGWWDDPLLGFEELCAGSVEAHALKAGHQEIMESALMAEYAKKTLALD